MLLLLASTGINPRLVLSFLNLIEKESVTGAVLFNKFPISALSVESDELL